MAATFCLAQPEDFAGQDARLLLDRLQPPYRPGDRASTGMGAAARARSGAAHTNLTWRVANTTGGPCPLGIGAGLHTRVTTPPPQQARLEVE
jgi:hypothetical protein